MSGTSLPSSNLIGPAAAPDWSAESDQSGALLGWSTSAGDVNGDGYADLVVGAPQYDHGETEEGVVFLYLGGPEGPADSPICTMESDQAYAWFGYAVSAAGDVNGDGYADLVVGAPRYDITGTVALTDTGQIFLYYGAPTGLVTSTLGLAHTDQAQARFGASVASAGDVNGDGYADVIVAANGYDAAERNEGAAFVYHGGLAGMETSPAWVAHPTGQAYANFGDSASTAGDVNGDGYSDVVIGAPWYDTSQDEEDRDKGAAYVYHGGPVGLNNAPAWLVTGNRREAKFGVAVSTAGDVNGDGYSDLIVGAYKYTEDYEHPWREGAAFAYHGSSEGLSSDASWSARGGQESAKYALSLSSAGDMNGDGYTDVVVGAPNYDGDHLREGAIFVYQGAEDGLTDAHAWSAAGDQEGAGIGFSTSAAGDVNGDGYGDLIVGAPAYNSGEMDEGAAFVYLGDGTGDLLGALPRQLRSADLSSIAPLGCSDSTNGVHLWLSAQLSATVSSVKLEWQLAPLGVPFTSTASNSGFISGTSPTWRDPLTSSVILSQTVDLEGALLEGALLEGALYHWRLRVLYWPGDAHSRWLYLPWNGPQEADFRTPVLLAPDRTIYAQPGQPVTSTHTLFNPAGKMQAFTLTRVSTPGYTVTVAASPGSLTAALPGFGRSPVTVAVQTNPTTPLGTQYTTIITVASDLSGQSTVYNTTWVANLVFLPLVLRN